MPREVVNQSADFVDIASFNNIAESNSFNFTLFCNCPITSLQVDTGVSQFNLLHAVVRLFVSA